MNMTVLLSI